MKLTCSQSALESKTASHYTLAGVTATARTTYKTKTQPAVMLNKTMWVLARSSLHTTFERWTVPIAIGCFIHCVCWVECSFHLVAIMPKVTSYTRSRIESLYNQGSRPAKIFKELSKEGLKVSFASVTRIIKKIQDTGSTKNLHRSGRPTKLSADAKSFIEHQMRKNNEATSRQIQKKLAKCGIMVHPSTVRRSRNKQGWTLQCTAYCQLIRDANKVKRLEYALQIMESGDTLHNVIFSDECSVSLEQYWQTCYRKVGELTKRKPKPKHLLKVHVWAGISRHGATKILQEILDKRKLRYRHLKTVDLTVLMWTLACQFSTVLRQKLE